MCNAHNHSNHCTCGFGGIGHKGKSHRHSKFVRSSKYSSRRTITPQSKLPRHQHNLFDYFSRTVPNIICKYCGDTIYYYENIYGSKVFFDELGPPWPKHDCYFIHEEDLQTKALNVLTDLVTYDTAESLNNQNTNSGNAERCIPIQVLRKETIGQRKLYTCMSGNEVRQFSIMRMYDDIDIKTDIFFISPGEKFSSVHVLDKNGNSRYDHKIQVSNENTIQALEEIITINKDCLSIGKLFLDITIDQQEFCITNPESVLGKDLFKELEETGAIDVKVRLYITERNNYLMVI